MPELEVEIKYLEKRLMGQRVRLKEATDKNDQGEINRLEAEIRADEARLRSRRDEAHAKRPNRGT